MTSVHALAVLTGLGLALMGQSLSWAIVLISAIAVTAIIGLRERT